MMWPIRNLVFLVIVLFAPVYAHAQSSGNSVISGKIIDGYTKEPLSGVHVFLASRLQGTTTDAEGNYEISGLSPGSYKVVASIIGYISASQEIEVLGSQNVRLNIPLDAVVYELDGVEVTGEQPEGWEEQLKIFNQRFLGRSGNAKESAILNPYVLNFEEHGAIFRADASEPLLIENLSLGYTITFILDHFQYNTSEEKSYTYGTWYFEEMDPESAEQEKEWERRREISFKGSLQHLLWAMVNGRTEDEGFSILRDYSEGESGPEIFLHRYHPVNVDDILSETEKPYEYEMSFDDYIRVYYLRTGEKRKLFRRVLIPAEQLSYLKATGKKITVHESGYMYGSRTAVSNLLVYGHLANLGVADLLPQEYALLRGD